MAPNGSRSSLIDRTKRLLIRLRDPARSTPLREVDRDERYRSRWNDLARADAMTAIFSPSSDITTVESKFDEAGGHDAEWLRRFVTPESVVLDIGCGIGRVEKHLAAHCARICSVDVSDEMIERARRWTSGRSNVEFYRTSATDLSAFPDATFDFAFSLLVLQHLDYEDAFLAMKEIARVLKPGSRALLGFPNLGAPCYAAAFIGQAVNRDRGPARVRMYTLDFATHLLEFAGFAVEGRADRPHGQPDPNELDLVVRRPDEC